MSRPGSKGHFVKWKVPLLVVRTCGWWAGDKWPSRYTTAAPCLLVVALESRVIGRVAEWVSESEFRLWLVQTPLIHDVDCLDFSHRRACLNTPRDPGIADRMSSLLRSRRRTRWSIVHEKKKFLCGWKSKRQGRIDRCPDISNRIRKKDALIIEFNMYSICGYPLDCFVSWLVLWSLRPVLRTPYVMIGDRNTCGDTGVH